MSKTKKLIIGTLISVVTLGGLVTYAGSGSFCDKSGAMNEQKSAFIINRISSKLDLNDVQKQNLVALKETLQAQKKLHKEDPRAELMELLSEPVLDETKVLSMLETRTTRLNLAAPTIVSAIANFTNSLNDEQRTEIKEFADKIGQHRGSRFGGRFQSFE